MQALAGSVLLLSRGASVCTLIFFSPTRDAMEILARQVTREAADSPQETEGWSPKWGTCVGVCVGREGLGYKMEIMELL